MSSRRIGLTAACLLAASTFGAGAQAQIVGDLDAGFGSTGLSSHAGHVDQWDGTGTALISLGNPGFDLQLDSSDAHLTRSNAQGTLWDAGASLLWRDWAGSIGATVAHGSFDGATSGLFGIKGDATSYGLFGEWYALDELTLRVKGGDVAGSIGGGYVSGGAAYYLMPDFAINGYFNYSSFKQGLGQWTSGGTTIEYLPVESLPVSFYVGYDYTMIDHHVDFGNTVLAGLTLHIGSLGQGHALVDYDRTSGTQVWDGALSPGGNLHL